MNIEFAAHHYSLSFTAMFLAPLSRVLHHLSVSRSARADIFVRDAPSRPAKFLYFESRLERARGSPSITHIPLKFIYELTGGFFEVAQHVTGTSPNAKCHDKKSVAISFAREQQIYVKWSSES